MRCILLQATACVCACETHRMQNALRRYDAHTKEMKKWLDVHVCMYVCMHVCMYTMYVWASMHVCVCMYAVLYIMAVAVLLSQACGGTRC